MGGQAGAGNTHRALIRFRARRLNLRREAKKAFNRNWQPYTRSYRSCLGDERRFRRLEAMLKGLLIAQTPKIQRLAAKWCPNVKPASAAKAGYRLLANPHLSADTLLAPLAHRARSLCVNRKQVLGIIDLSSIEKPYARKMEGLCRVRRNDASGTTNGYELLTILFRADRDVGLAAYRLFSHQAEAMSQNWEIESKMSEVRERLPAKTKVIWVWDRGFDDRKNYQRVLSWRDGFVGRVYHNRRVTVGGRLRSLLSWGRGLRLRGQFSMRLSYRGRRRRVRIGLSWGRFRFEGHWLWLLRAQILWVEGLLLDHVEDREWWLMTDQALHGRSDAITVWGYYRQRWEIENFFKFLKEGFELEDFQVMKLEEIRRITALVAIVAMFIYQLSGSIGDEPARLLYQLGGWTGRGKPGKAALQRGLASFLNYLAVGRLLSLGGFT